MPPILVPVIGSTRRQYLASGGAGGRGGAGGAAGTGAGGALPQITV